MVLFLMIAHSSWFVFFIYTPDEILLWSHNSGSLSLIHNANIASFVTKSKILAMLWVEDYVASVYKHNEFARPVVAFK